MSTETVTRGVARARDAVARGSRLIQMVATPGSGSGRALVTARELRDALLARHHRVRLELFSDLESLRRWVGSGGAGASLLICVGGDGTQSTAAIAAVRRSVPFIPVPTGFGNLFARALGLTPRVDRVVELVQDGELVHVDVGVRNRELFLCQESFGLLAEIQHRAEASASQPRAKWRRSLAYYEAAVRHIVQAPLTRLRVAVDGRVVARDAAVVTVANVETYGEWLPLTPAASPVDGLFDVFVMWGASKREVLTRLIKRHLRVPGPERGTRLSRGRRVSIVAPDGARDELEVIPRRLPVIVSRATARALERRAARLNVPARIDRRQAA